MPSLVGIRGVQEGENITATVSLVLNPAVDSYRVDWFSSDSTEFGNLIEYPSVADTGPTIDIPVPGLTPGQSYVFRVVATEGNQTVVGLDYPVTFGTCDFHSETTTLFDLFTRYILLTSVAKLECNDLYVNHDLTL